MHFQQFLMMLQNIVDMVFLPRHFQIQRERRYFVRPDPFGITLQRVHGYNIIFPVLFFKKMLQRIFSLRPFRMVQRRDLAESLFIAAEGPPLLDIDTSRGQFRQLLLLILLFRPAFFLRDSFSFRRRRVPIRDRFR